MRVCDDDIMGYLEQRLDQPEAVARWREVWISCILCNMSDDLDEGGLCEDCVERVAEYARGFITTTQPKQELKKEIPNALTWNIMKYMVHPTAVCMKEVFERTDWPGQILNGWIHEGLLRVPQKPYFKDKRFWRRESLFHYLRNIDRVMKSMGLNRNEEDEEEYDDWYDYYIEELWTTEGERWDNMSLGHGGCGEVYFPRAFAYP